MHVLLLLEVRHAGGHLRHYVDKRRQPDVRALALRVRVQRSVNGVDTTGEQERTTYLAQVVEQRAVSQELGHNVDGLPRHALEPLAACARRALQRALRAHGQQAHQVLVLQTLHDGRLLEERAGRHAALRTQLLHRHVHGGRALLAVTLRAAQQR